MFTQAIARALSRLGLDQRGTDPHPRQPMPMLPQKADAMFSSHMVAGYLPSPRGFSTLILGQHNREGNFVYAGFCGTGLSEETRAVILEELKATGRKTCPFRTVPELRDDFRELPDVPPRWVRPSVVVEVEYRQRLKDGLRHSALKGIRPDKKPRTIRLSPLSERGPFTNLIAY